MKVHLLFFTFVWCDVYTGKSYKDHGIFDITVTSANVGDVLKSLDTTYSLDWLKPHEGATYTIGTKTSILVDPEDKDAFQTVLQEQGVAYSKTSSIDAEIETAFTEIDSQKDSRKRNWSKFSFEEYHTVDQIDAWLNGEVNSHDNAKVSVYGKSIEGRDLTVVSIGNARNPAIIVDCGMHAREWVSFAFCLYLINDLLNGEVAAWTNDIHWVIYPMLNPDGYQYSWTNDRYWRKNRNPNNGARCKGVDLNRNYDIEWMEAGTSSYECHVTYGGKGPFSEPESRFHRDHMLTIENKKAYLTYHAYSEFIIYPYSSSFAAEAYNKVELNRLANEMQYAIKSVNNKVYQYGEGAVAFGVASGGSDDWSHANGVPISYTVELRDTGHYGFLLPKTQILPTCLENIRGIRVVYEHVRPADNCGETSCGENGTCIYRQPSNSLECLCKEGFEAAYRRSSVTCKPIVKEMSMEQHAANRQDTVVEQSAQTDKKDEHDLDKIYNNIKSKEYSKQNETHSIHRQLVKRKYPTRKIITHYPFQIFMADLIEYTKPGYRHANNGYKYILLVIDCFSKIVWTRPMKKKNKETTAEAMDSVLSSLDNHPNTVITEEGLELYHRATNDVFQKYGILHYSIKSDKKTSMAERAIQTLKNRLEKYFYDNHTNKWIDVVEQMTANYNNTTHRTIGMAPSAVNDTNRKQVFNHMFPNINVKTVPKLQIGDTVRLLQKKGPFVKGYKRTELYHIASVHQQSGVVWYTLKDESGYTNPKTRYYWELNKVSH